MPPEHKSGFVSILGRPNAGKSTLLNALVGQKVSIVADKPQTTRTAIQGVMTTPEAQVIFIDTPGIHRSTSAINRRMMEAVRGSLEERDLLIFTVDSTHPFSEEDEMALSTLRNGAPPVIAAFNKIDALESKQQLLPLLEEYGAAVIPAYPISTRPRWLKITRDYVSYVPEVTVYYFIDSGKSFDSYAAQLPGKVQHELRRKLRRFTGYSGGQIDLRTYRSVAEAQIFARSR